MRYNILSFSMHLHNYMNFFIVIVGGPTFHNVSICQLQLFDEHVIEKNYSIWNNAPTINIPISSSRVLPPIVQPMGMYHLPHPLTFSFINSSMPIATSPKPSKCPPLPFNHPPFSLFQSPPLTFQFPP